MSIPSGTGGPKGIPPAQRSRATGDGDARDGGRARRIRLKRLIRQEAARRMAEIHATPTLRELYAPRALFAAVVVLFLIGGLLVGRAGRAARHPAPRAIPHLTAIRSLDTLATALGRYKFHTGVFPTTELGLPALNKDMGVPGWDGPYLVQLFDDPWGHDYVYEAPAAPGALPKLFSLGPDGQPGTPDDLFPGTNSYNVGTDWTNGWRHRWERLPQIK